MEANHTPAPWTISGPHAGRGISIVADGNSIARVYAHPDAEANAKLIAAAPDLLKFALRFVDRFEAEYSDEVDSPLVIEAKAAITKATS